MFEPNASWSLPEHLFQVSEWSALCTRHDDPWVPRTRCSRPAPPFRQRPPPRRPRRATRRSTRGPISHTCCTSTTSAGRTTSSPGASPTARMTPRCRASRPSRTPRRPASGTRCRTSTPSKRTASWATSVRRRLLRRREERDAARRRVVRAVNAVSEHPPGALSPGRLRHQHHQRRDALAAVEQHRDLPRLGRLGRLLRPRRAAARRRARLRPARPGPRDQRPTRRRVSSITKCSASTPT